MPPSIKSGKSGARSTKVANGVKAKRTPSTKASAAAARSASSMAVAAAASTRAGNDRSQAPGKKAAATVGTQDRKPSPQSNKKNVNGTPRGQPWQPLAATPQRKPTPKLERGRSFSSSSSSSDSSLLMVPGGVQDTFKSDSALHQSNQNKPYVAFLDDVPSGDSDRETSSSDQSTPKASRSATSSSPAGRPSQESGPCNSIPPAPLNTFATSGVPARGSVTSSSGDTSSHPEAGRGAGVVSILDESELKKSRRARQQRHGPHSSRKTSGGDASANGSDSADSPTSIAGTTLPCSQLDSVQQQQPSAPGPLNSPSPQQCSHAHSAEAVSPASNATPVHEILEGMSRKAAQRVRQPRAACRHSSDHVVAATGSFFAAASTSESSRLTNAEQIYEELAMIQRSCGYGLNADEEAELRAAELGVGLLGPWMAAGAPSGEKGVGGGGAVRGGPLNPQSGSPKEHKSQRRARSLEALSAATILRILQYCDLRSLGQVACVNARFHVLSQFTDLWLTHAIHLGIPVGGVGSRPSSSAQSLPSGNATSAAGRGSVVNTAAIREAMRQAVEKRNANDEAELRHFEKEFGELERRMAARAEANYKQAIDVNRTLATHNPGAILDGSFSRTVQQRLRQQAMELEDSLSEGGAARSASAAERFRAMLQQLRALEVTRAHILATVEANTRSLAEQHHDLLALRQRTDAALSGRVAAAAVTDAARKQREPSPTSSARDAIDTHPSYREVLDETFVTYGEFCAFEKRISRLVLNGGYNSNTAVEAAVAQVVPLVLRRGVSDFATLELTLMQLAPSAAAATAASDEASRVRRAIAARWAAFQTFCPLNDDFYLVRQFLQDRRGPGHTDGVTDAHRTVSKRLETALLRLSGIVRKVTAMKDAEVMSVIM